MREYSSRHMIRRRGSHRSLYVRACGETGPASRILEPVMRWFVSGWPAPRCRWGCGKGSVLRPPRAEKEKKASAPTRTQTDSAPGQRRPRLRRSSRGLLGWWWGERGLWRSRHPSGRTERVVASCQGWLKRHGLDTSVVAARKMRRNWLPSASTCIRILIDAQVQAGVWRFQVGWSRPVTCGRSNVAQ